MRYSSPLVRQLCTTSTVMLAVMLFVAGYTHADATGVTPIGPFSGQYHEDFNSGPVFAYASLRTFSDTTTLAIEDDPTSATSIKIETNSSLGGDLVHPISGKMMGQLGILDWEFNTPVSQFGGYWENNSHADDATVKF